VAQDVGDVVTVESSGAADRSIVVRQRPVLAGARSYGAKRSSGVDQTPGGR